MSARVFALVWGLIFLTAAFAQEPDKKLPEKTGDQKDAKKDEKKEEKPTVKAEPTILEGVWQVVTRELSGKKADGKEIEGLRLIFKGNQLTIKKGEKVVGAGTIKLDPSQTPALWDYVEAKDVYSPYDTGLFVLEGETLKLCTTADRKNRPSALDSKQGWLLELKREKK